jgi:hypothetical protein
LWTLAAWVQVVLPGLYWPHYYLLPTPGAALAVGVMLAESVRGARRGRGVRRGVAALVALGLSASMIGSIAIQVRDYLLVPPMQLTVRYKGGAQWVRLRQIGREIAARRRADQSPGLYVWGWQSPLYFYSGLDSPSRHFFANELLKAEATRARPGSLAGAWLVEVVRDLEARPPALIFTGDPPFPALRAFIQAHYVRSRLVPEAPALWVRSDRAGEFEGVPAGAPGRPLGPRDGFTREPVD